MSYLAFLDVLKSFTFLHPPKFSVTNLLIGLVLAVAGIELLAILIAHLVFRDSGDDRKNQWRGKDL